ncbi:MAG: DNA/RNA nuclease SfsA [Candidatus Sedimenticola sp. (ex Thyasira tokunagai)]
MKLPPLTAGRILRRYKRFLADVELNDGTQVTAHCPNTGRMTGCWAPGAPVQLSFSDNPKRKLSWTLERVDMGRGWVGVNTARTNSVVAEAITEGRVSVLAGYQRLQREVRFTVPGHPASRLDLLLSEGMAKDALVEIKNVTLLVGDSLQFPDAVSERARKHLDMLVAAVERGMRGVILFAVNRPEGDYFTPAVAIDPEYGARLKGAVTAGVEAYALRLQHTPDGIIGDVMVPVEL